MTSVAQYFYHHPRIAILLLALSHIVGIVGFNSPFAEWFMILTPLNLLLCCFLLLSGHSHITRSTLFGLAGIGLIGFIIEWVGVHTGIIFGEYTYGRTLGPKIDEIPVIISINWLMLTYAIGNVVARFSTDFYWRIILGAILMVGLDLIIEPVAIRFDMWQWETESVPLMNYLAWFIVSIGTMTIYFKSVHGQNNKMAEWVILSQLLFFGLLNFV